MKKSLFLLLLLFCGGVVTPAFFGCRSAKFCAEKYPCKVDTLNRVDTFVSMDTTFTVVPDSFYFYENTINEFHDTLIIKKPCPPTKTITKEVMVNKDVRFMVKDTAQIKMLTLEIDKYKKKYEWSMKINFFLMGLLIVILLLFLFFRKVV